MTWTTVLTAIVSALWLAHHGGAGIDVDLHPATDRSAFVLPSEPTAAGPAASQASAQAAPQAAASAPAQ